MRLQRSRRYVTGKGAFVGRSCLANVARYTAAHLRVRGYGRAACPCSLFECCLSIVTASMAAVFVRSKQVVYHVHLVSVPISQHYKYECCTAPGMRTEYRVDKVPFFKHCEEFRLGRETVMGRRDKKSGQQRAFLREVPEGLQIDIQLGQPFPGLALLSK